MKITPFTFESLASEDATTSAALLAGELPPEVEEEVEEEVPTFSEEELEAAKKEGYDNGFMAGKKEGRREAEKEGQQHQEQIQQVVGKINQSLQALQQDYQTVLQQRQSELGKLVLACADKLAGEALRKDPVSDISEMIEASIAGLFDAPEIIAKLHPEIAPLLENTLPKNVTITSDETLQMGDCQLNWQHGQAMRDSAQLWGELEAIVDRHFARAMEKQQEVPVEDTLPEAVAAEPVAAPAEAAPVEITPEEILDVTVEATPAPQTDEIPSVTTDTEGEDHE